MKECHEYTEKSLCNTVPSVPLWVEIKIVISLIVQEDGLARLPRF